ncbi:hypothetical protein DCS_02488 [Drechmeria coniospora]|uniref:ATPase synthesis protein 25 n=1 Tax=Drechmeria coniospora TaxID=98403 RepID=A0A151GW63_DRECN|nr:hypothetical protein DCS_02488 [Drechmeria coniospora]KYK61346.1 hypothetical protein DCS_02488 [Drechmeria coniospora]ODA81108.1 hypothetical protein RJ55_04071 [Drechmeria coniospora]
MISRPVVTALGCCGCRTAIYRAVLGPASSRSPHGSSQAPPRLQRPARLFSSSQHEKPIANVSSGTKASEFESDGTKHWFLDEEPPRHPAKLHKQTLPKSPENAPSMLEPMMNYIYEDMGLDDLSLLDLRDLDTPAALGPNLIMIFGTARSERHLHVSSGRFVRWLRKKHNVDANAGGLIGPGELKTKLRRLRKKAKLMGTNTMILPGGDNGISTGWVCVSFSSCADGAAETMSFDDSGRFSGFGASSTGTTVVVQCMTESRRAELDLESLWQGILRRSLEKTRKMKGEPVVDDKEMLNLIASKVQQPSNPSALQWQALQQASQQQRRFSTLARRLHFQAEQQSQRRESPKMVTDDESTLASSSTSADANLEILAQRIRELQTSGIPLKQDALESLVRAIFHVSPATAESVALRLELADELLLTAQERGMTIWSRDVLVTLIESVVSCAAYGPELQRAQRNLELVLLELQTPLDQGQVLRLMMVYGQRQDWTRFWDAFRSPARFQAARSPELYRFAYQVMASTGDAKMCIEALRWVYPEMLKEEPPVLPAGRLYDALKSCILVADPAAEGLQHCPPPSGTLDLVSSRRLKRREFVRVLKEVEDLRRHMAGAHAREERARALNRFSGSSPGQNAGTE